MNWQLLTAVSVVTLSASVLLQRVLLHKDKSDPIAYVVVFNALTGLLIVTYSLIHGFHIPNLSQYWWIMAGTIFLYSAGHVMYAKTLQLVEASVFSILFATNAIWAMLIGLIVFHERLSLPNVLGAILIFSGVILLAERREKIKIDRGILFGLITGVLFGVATIGWDMLVVTLMRQRGRP